ncbi:type VII secretion protein EccB [Saccharopolyspora sp. NPDC050642]|uniref:type VII secretion protein EccB n=1 Tax=Saccharopolyspora sp. NPDC050642 TaxID=3157099 RepID=UPI0033EA7DC8
MQTQRDHVHAYQFLMGRMSSALVLGDPASVEVPARRAAVGVYIGLVLALLIAVGFGIYGWLVPGGNNSWRAQGAIVVEKETGTRYVNVDGVLHPTLNYASAKLLQGPNAGAKVTLLSRASLADAPRGAPLGIPNAPQILPAAQDLVGSNWLTCLPGSAGAVAPGSPELTLNFDPGAPAAPLPPDRYALVQSPEGTQYVLWGGAKHQVAEPTVPIALGMAAARPVPAPQPWLDALPDGPVLASAQIDGSGTSGPSIGGKAYRVGQLFEQRSANGDVQTFVLRREGLAPISRTEFMLLEVAPGTPEPARIDPAAVASAPRSADRSLLGRLPDLSGARWQDHGPAAICLRQAPVGPRIASEVVFAGPGAAAGGVHMRPGTGVVVAALPIPPGQRVPDRYLITGDSKYLLPDDDSMRALGYAGVPVRPIANDLLATVPSGPALSQAAVGATRKG